MAKSKSTLTKGKTVQKSPEARPGQSYAVRRRKLQQRIVFGVLAAVLGFGLIASSIVWIPGFQGQDNTPREAQPAPTTAELEEKAKANPKDTGILVQLADAYQRENNAPKAVETYEKAVSLEPGRDDLKDRLAGGYLSVGQYDRAIKILEEVIGRSPNDKEAHYYYGHALVAKKEYKLAVDEFQRYVALAGENDPQAENAKRLIETLKPLVDKNQ